ncbi:MAG: PAS sensor domain-containing protein [Arcobacter sp.]|nr:MAG: PAS sensor domain-containing protein [Arcobacter sp.]
MSKEVKLDKATMIVSETDEKGIITYVNDDFCNISGFTKDELIRQAHNIVRHKDMPKSLFKDLWKSVKAGKTWKGIVKNFCKNGDFYWVSATVFPVIKKSGKTKLISIRTKPSSDEVNSAMDLYATLRGQE